MTSVSNAALRTNDALKLAPNASSIPAFSAIKMVTSVVWEYRLKAKIPVECKRVSWIYHIWYHTYDTFREKLRYVRRLSRIKDWHRPGASNRYVLFSYVRKDASCLLYVLNSYFADRIKCFYVERWARQRQEIHIYVHTRTYNTT